MASIIYLILRSARQGASRRTLCFPNAPTGKAQIHRGLPRLFAEHRAATDDARLLRGVVAFGLMHEAAIVPDHEVAGSRAMLVAARQPDDALVEPLDEPPTLVIAHADDALGMIAEEEALASGLGMRAHDRMIDRRHRRTLHLGHRVLAVPAVARE